MVFLDSPSAGNPFPGGSPTAATGTSTATFDGMEVARRMVQAAEAAAVAARAATRAVQEASTSSRPSTDDSKQWWKLLPKPPTFDHSSRESEISAWREWSWSFEQYVASVDAKFSDDIQQLRANIDKVVDPVGFTDMERQRNHFLYSLLSSLLRQRPLLVLRQASVSNGLEAYRLGSAE